MSDSLANAAGKGLTITLKDKEYRLSVLTIDDLAEFESYLASQKLRNILAIAEGMAWEEKKQLITVIAQSPIGDTEIASAMSSMSGVRFLLYRALMKNKDVELEKMGEIVDLSNFNEAMEIINNIGGETIASPPPIEEVETKA